MRTIRVISISLLFFVAVNALIAGGMFIIDPSGNLIGIPLAVLKDSPFKDFLIPGIVLLIVNGLFNVVAAIVTIGNWKKYPIMIMAQGILLIGWIIVQMLQLREINFLHVTMSTIGLILLAFGMWLNSGIAK